MTALANSRVLKNGELDNYSLKIAFSKIPTEHLKPVAQKIRENIDWYGRNTSANYGILYDCIMEVIHIVEPDFKTEFIPAI
jgi:hypothetical protein